MPWQNPPKRLEDLFPTILGRLRAREREDEPLRGEGPGGGRSAADDMAHGRPHVRRGPWRIRPSFTRRRGRS